MRLLFLLVIPVLLTALPLGIASAGSLLKLGRTALIALIMALGLGAFGDGAEPVGKRSLNGTFWRR